MERRIQGEGEEEREGERKRGRERESRRDTCGRKYSTSSI